MHGCVCTCMHACIERMAIQCVSILVAIIQCSVCGSERWKREASGDKGARARETKRERASLSFFLSLSLSVSVSIFVFIFLSVSVSVSVIVSSFVSLSAFVPICACVCVCVCVCWGGCATTCEILVVSALEWAMQPRQLAAVQSHSVQAHCRACHLVRVSRGSRSVSRGRGCGL